MTEPQPQHDPHCPPTILDQVTAPRTDEVELNKQLLETIYGRIEDYAIFSLDPHGIITSWAKGAEKMKQYTREEVLGHHFSMLYPEEGRLRNEPMNHLQDAVREGRFRGEGLRQKKNGDLFLADVFITPMYVRDELYGFFKIVTDLSEANRLIQERDLSRTRAETLELESELRERFIFTLSHDLKNPLSAALMSTQLIARHPCNVDNHRSQSHRAIFNIERVDKMVTDLLDAGRIKSGQAISIRIEEYDLAADLAGILHDLSTQYGDRFRYDGPATVPGFWDRGAIRRVIENLCINAVKYGDPRREITTCVNPVADRVLISVHNYGSAIASEEQSSLFDLFRRTSSAEQSAKKGWGLGLTLVRGITEAHGGIVQVKSFPREGTTFLLDLPRDARASGRAA